MLRARFTGLVEALGQESHLDVVRWHFYKAIKTGNWGGIWQARHPAFYGLWGADRFLLDLAGPYVRTGSLDQAGAFRVLQSASLVASATFSFWAASHHSDWTL